MRTQAGCLLYTAALEDAHAARILVVERWQDQAALNAHLDAPHTSEFVGRWLHRMEGEVRKYDAANERPLTG